MMKIEHRRHDIDNPGHVSHMARCEPGHAHDERHLQRALTHEDAVAVFTVLPESLTVIAGHDDQRALQLATRLSWRFDIRGTVRRQVIG